MNWDTSALTNVPQRIRKCQRGNGFKAGQRSQITRETDLRPGLSSWEGQKPEHGLKPLVFGRSKLLRVCNKISNKSRVLGIHLIL